MIMAASRSRGEDGSAGGEEQAGSLQREGGEAVSSMQRRIILPGFSCQVKRIISSRGVDYA